MMMSLLLYILVLLFYLIQLIVKSILSYTNKYTPTESTTEKNHDAQDDNGSLHVNPAEEKDVAIEKNHPRDYLLLNAMEYIQSRISVTMQEELLSNSYNAKSIITSYCLKSSRTDNESYGLAYSLSVLTTSVLNMPALPLQCILFLTNAFRVPTEELPLFILNVLSPDTIVHTMKEEKLELLNYSDFSINTTTTDEQISVSILEKLNHLEAELWLTLPNRMAPITVSPTSSTLSKRNSITSIDSSSSFTTNNSTLTSLTTNDGAESIQYKLFNFLEDDSIIKERLNPFNTSYDDMISFKSNFYKVKSKIVSLLKHDQGLNVLHKNRLIQVENAVKFIIQNCNYLETRLIEFQSGYVFTQLYQFTSTFIMETVYFMEKLEREKAVINHQDLIDLESCVYNNVNLAQALYQAFATTTYNDKIKELSERSHDLLEKFKTISDAWYKIHGIKSLLEEGKSFLTTLDLSDEYLSQYNEQVLQSIQFIQKNVYSTAHQDYQLLASDLYLDVLQKTADKTLSCHERITNTIVYSVLEDLQTFKNDLICCTLITQKYFNKQKLKRDIEQASHWLKAFKCNLVTFSLLDGCLSTSSNIKSEVFNFQVQYDEFVLAQYNEICEYFTRYASDVLNEQYKKKNIHFKSYQLDDLNYQQLGDNYLFEEYMWFIKLQTLCDETSQSLKVLNVLCN